MNGNKDTGVFGENAACEYLLKNQYTIIERNWRYKHWEIDIIAVKDNKIHFVEVKTRSSNSFGHPEEGVTNKKMSFLKKAAAEYLYQHPEWIRIQFDVIAIKLNGKEVTEIFWIDDVFF